MNPVVIFCTVPNKNDAKKISEALVQEGLAACVSTIDKVNSIFSWDNELCNENELLLIIKTRQEVFDKIEAVIKALHPYNVPEIIALPVIAGSKDYLAWVEHETEQ
ncbi:divalent-cation tolerance protein CutA [bacterium]|nr:divalent-cation tolerance protein CutA [bacterium]